MLIRVLPTNDAVFKFVFGAQERIDVLTLFLNAVFADSGDAAMEDVQLANPSSVQENADDRHGVLDIRARDNSGRQSLIEMQMLAHAFLAERLLWNLAKHYGQQLEKGKPYSTLRPVIMVCILNDTLFEDDSGQYHWCFKLFDQKCGRQLTDQFAIHVIELPKFTKRLDELVSELDRWTYFLKHGAELDLNDLPPSLQNVGITKAVEGLVMFSQDDQRWHEYLMQQIWEMDQQAYIEGALQKGERMGAQRGRTEGELTMLVRIGSRKLGAPPPDVLAQLAAVENVSELESLSDRLLEISSWSELFSHQS